MNGISGPSSDLLLILAMASGGVVWWVLRTRQLRRRAMRLRKRSESELSLHQARLEQLRERALAVADFDSWAMTKRHAALAQEGEEDLASIQVLREELVRASRGVEGSYGRRLQDSHRAIEAVGAKVVKLAGELRRREAIWAAKVARLEADSAAQALARFAS